MIIYSLNTFNKYIIFPYLKRFSSFSFFQDFFGRMKIGHLFLSIFKTARYFWIFEKVRKMKKTSCDHNALICDFRKFICHQLKKR